MRRFGTWWWLSLLIPILVCSGIMGLLLSNGAANEVRDSSVAALDGAGLGAAVDFAGIEGFGGDGINVVLEGPASAEAAAVEAVKARSQVENVTYRVTDDDATAEPEDEVDADAEADGQEPEPEPEPAVDLEAAVVSALATAGTIHLEGTVPDEATRDALIAGAVNEYGASNVTHDLVVDPETVTLEGGTLVLTGEAVSGDEQSGWIERTSAVAVAGGLELDDRTTVTSVEQSLNELFTLEPIEFDVNRATIRSRSEPTLAAAAELINANPDVGRLRVVGHTDSDGSSQANQQLSEARAQAVVDHLVANGGVDAERLEAEGRGESELLVDPEVTAEDKQRNRRIAWELLS